MSEKREKVNYMEAKHLECAFNGGHRRSSGDSQSRADSHRGEDRKFNLVVNELRRYDVKVAALQETKWFGSKVYQVSGTMV